MPVYTETAHSARDLRILPSRAPPLPRISLRQDGLQNSERGSIEKHEVVVIGAGPSGLFLTLLLARYGLRGSSLVCYDSKPGTLKAGQADGLQPRTLEVLESLGIADEIIREGCHMSEVAFWNPKQQAHTNGIEKLNATKLSGIERTDFVSDVNVAARFPFEVTIHQGRIERILEENLHLYAPENTVRRSHRVVDFKVDEAGDAEYPILITTEKTCGDGSVSQISSRTKYLVGADGAHSLVRRGMGLHLEGETTDHIWGVCDFVVDTDFPDIRKRCAVHSAAGSVMVIPRERIATGEYLTRLYVQVPGEASPDADVVSPEGEKKVADKKRRTAITLEYIFDQARKVFAPYTIQIKEGTDVDWWAAYQIGQRMTSKFSSRTSDGVDRVFIVGDACHTHSPKAGQGMNVSMMDSYNLSWKLIHSIHGLTPRSAKGTPDCILETFEQERVGVARQLIDFDSKFSSMFSGQIGSKDPSLKDLTHEEFLKVFSEGSGFTSGCGLEYEPSAIVKSSGGPKGNPVTKHEPLKGTLTEGRRLLDVQVRRYADANLRHLHDEMPSTGRYRVLALASTDLLDRTGVSSRALQSCANLLQKFPLGVIELLIVHPLTARFEWVDLPKCVKDIAEMRLFGLAATEDLYDVYGVPKEQGAMVVVRPDGYVGMIGHLSEVDDVEAYFRGCLVGLAGDA